VKGKAVRTSPSDALLYESVSEKRRGAAFGLHRTLDQAGAIVGPVIASAAMLVLGFTVRDILWLSLIPGSIALFIILFLVKERVAKSTSDFKLLSGVKSALKGNFSFVLLNAQEAGVADSLIPLVYAAVNVAHTAVAIPAGVLSDRVGKEKVMILGYGIFLSTTLLFLVPATRYVALLVAVMYGAYIGVVETVQRALIPDYVGEKLREQRMGFTIWLLVQHSLFLTLWSEVYGSI